MLTKMLLPKQGDTFAWLGKAQLHPRVACRAFLCHPLFLETQPPFAVFYCSGWFTGDEYWGTLVLGLLQRHRNVCWLLSKDLVAKAACFQILQEPWHGPALSKESPSRSRVLDLAVEPPVNIWSKRGGEVGLEGYACAVSHRSHSCWCW